MRKFDNNLELDINHIMTEEVLGKDDIPDYLKMSVLRTLIKKGVYNKLDEILTDKRIKTKEELIEKYPRQYEVVPQKIDGIHSYAVYDYYSSLIITPTDRIYNLCFAFKLKQQMLHQIDRFLDYHCEVYFSNDLRKFSRFLSLLLREFQGKFINKATIDTALEWIEIKSSIPTIEAPDLGEFQFGKVEVASDSNKGDSQNDKSEQEEIMNIEQLAKMLSVKISTIYSWTSDRKIPFLKTGKNLIFKRSDILKWIDEGRRKTIKEIKQEADELRYTRKRK